MATQQRPSLADLNTTRYIAESVPGQIRDVQSKLRELEASRRRLREQLDLLLDTAVLHGEELCPESRPENGNAAGPGGADGASIRGVA